MAVNVLGLITVNGKQFLEVDSDPSAGVGLAAPRGSMAMLDNGTTGVVFIKTGTADNAWASIETPEFQHWLITGNTLAGNEVFGSLNDFDVPFIRNSVEVMRLFGSAATANGLLIGLNASMGGKLQVMANGLGDEIMNLMSPNGGQGNIVSHVVRQYKAYTTDATPTVLASLAVPVGSRVYATLRIGANQTAGSTGSVGDGAVYERDIDAKCVTTQAGAVLNRVQTSFTSEDVGATALDVQFAAASGNINGSVIGMANRSLTWMAHVEMTIFGN